MPCGYGKWDSELVKTRKKKGTKGDSKSDHAGQISGNSSCPKVKKNDRLLQSF